jgi:murein DD-endopeptidase MepM/ murein hydrolase activator NlpD
MYTLIFMSSRGNLVRQQAISRGDVLLFWIVIFVLFLGVIGGLGYGFYLKQQEAVSKKDSQRSMAEIEGLVRAKRQAESELAAINEEMKDIRHMAKQIQETLGIFGQGGGNSDITSVPEEAEGGDDIQQENAEATPDAVIDTHERQESLTPTSLKQEIQPLYNYVSVYRKGLDGYPSILPVKLQRANGEKYGFWYSSGFGRRVHPLTKRREFHSGLDIKTRSGVPVIAAADGTVVKVGRNGFLGNTVEIIHEESQFKTLHAHLKGYARGLKVGQKVARGQTIGYVGNTGRSTGAHLHYGVYDISNEKWVNPMAYIFDQQPMFSQ